MAPPQGGLASAHHRGLEHLTGMWRVWRGPLCMPLRAASGSTGCPVRLAIPTRPAIARYPAGKPQHLRALETAAEARPLNSVVNNALPAVTSAEISVAPEPQ